jgi:hypothetical protein
MGEHTVVGLPRPGGMVEDDPLLAVLREGARRMLTHAIEAEVAGFSPPTTTWLTTGDAAAWCATATRRAARSRPGSARSKSAAARA